MIEIILGLLLCIVGVFILKTIEFLMLVGKPGKVTVLPTGNGRPALPRHLISAKAVSEEMTAGNPDRPLTSS